MTDTSKDAQYLSVIIEPLHVCAAYKPMFGQGRKGGLSLGEFQTLYRGDHFYNWVGLDSPLMYAAHKAAGGMTSIYRQIGMGCQWVFQQMLRDYLGLTTEQANWSYQVAKGTGVRTLSLDGRIELAHVADATTRKRATAWLDEAKARAGVPKKMADELIGAVFEARQGYKSKDSKRQNADINNAVNAYQNFYLPAVILFSTQIDEDMAKRYQAEKWLMLVGTTKGSTTDSTYVFCRDVVGYDLAAFFERNSGKLRAEVESVLKAILSA